MSLCAFKKKRYVTNCRATFPFWRFRVALKTQVVPGRIMAAQRYNGNPSILMAYGPYCKAPWQVEFHHIICDLDTIIASIKAFFRLELLSL